MFLPLASDLGFIKQESNFHSDLSSNLHIYYMTRFDERKKIEQATTAPALNCGLIPDLLDYLVDDKPVPKCLLLLNEQ